MTASASEHEVSGISSTSDTSLRPTGPTDDSSVRSAHLRGRLGSLGRWGVAAAAVTVVVAALAVLLLGRAGMFSTGLPAGTSGTSGAWQTYHDPLGLFTLRLPPGWMAQVKSGTTMIGDRSGSAQVRAETITFDDSTQGTGSAYFWVDAESLKTAVGRRMFCREPSIRQSFSPRTLSSMEQTGALWFITTENASFQVDVAIPGVVTPLTYGGPWVPQPTATPIPAMWAAADQSEVNAMLVSFQPTNPKPLTC